MVWQKVLTPLWLYKLLMSNEGTSLGKVVYCPLKISWWIDTLWQPMDNQSSSDIGVFIFWRGGCSV